MTAATVPGYDSASLAAVELSAILTVEQHLARPGRTYAPGVCAGCTPHGCPYLTWAERFLAEHDAPHICEPDPLELER